MAQRLPTGYVLDPADPRSPSEEEWAAMTAAERAKVVAMLPAEVPWELSPPEGDWHQDAKIRAKGTLNEFFRRAGRRIYVTDELAVYETNVDRYARLGIAEYFIFDVGAIDLFGHRLSPSKPAAYVPIVP